MRKTFKRKIICILLAYSLLVMQVQSAHAADIQEATMVIKGSMFNPETIYLEKGKPARLTIINQDPQAHGFGAYELNINGRIEPGKSITIDVPTEKNGTFSFYCIIYCGSNHYPMAGKIVISSDINESSVKEQSIKTGNFMESNPGVYQNNLTIEELTPTIIKTIIIILSVTILISAFLSHRINKISNQIFMYKKLKSTRLKR